MREAAVAALEAVAKDYRSVMTAAGALASAFREYEETRAVLVELAVAYPFDALPLPEELGRTWEALADDFGKLQLALKAPAAGSLPNPVELERLTQSVLAGRQNLRRSLALAESASVRQYENLLRWPHWSWPERERLLSRLAEADGSRREKCSTAGQRSRPTATPRRRSERCRVRSAGCAARSRSCGWPMWRAPRT
jgi:hypothetical protein